MTDGVRRLTGSTLSGMGENESFEFRLRFREGDGGLWRGLAAGVFQIIHEEFQGRIIAKEV